MAQVIKLRRSSVAGNVPTTAQLGLGELAINTTDGKIYFEKNDGSATIQTIVTTNSQTTGSIEITGHFSGSATSTGSFGYIKSVTHDTATVTSTNVEVTNNIDFEGDISGSVESTGSFGSLVIADALQGATVAKGNFSVVKSFPDIFTKSSDEGRIGFMDAGGSIQSGMKNASGDLILIADGNIERVRVNSDGLTVTGTEGENGIINLFADDGDDNADKWRLVSSTAGQFAIQSYYDGAWQSSLVISQA